jgi:hypothetical protein
VVDTGILGEIQEIWIGRFRGHAGRLRADTEKVQSD